MISLMMLILIQYQMMSVLSYSGSSTTQEAKKTAIIVSRLISFSEANEFVKFLIQIETRNLKFQNVFFVIDWNIILAVSSVFIDNLQPFKLMKIFFSDNIDNCHIFSHHMPVWYLKAFVASNFNMLLLFDDEFGSLANY